MEKVENMEARMVVVKTDMGKEVGKMEVNVEVKKGESMEKVMVVEGVLVKVEEAITVGYVEDVTVKEIMEDMMEEANMDMVKMVEVHRVGEVVV